MKTILFVLLALIVISCSPDTTSCAYKVKYQKKAIKAKEKTTVVPYYVRTARYKH